MAVSDHQTLDLNPAALSATLHVAKVSMGHVVFSNVPEVYDAGSDVVVKYTIGSDLEVSSRDWIGLYKVGWRSTENYECYEWSPTVTNRVAGRESENSVIFSASKLPKDDDEFYQFCYITSKNQVRGLSAPFQFRKLVSTSSSLDDLIEIEDDNGELLIIKSKTAYLDDQLKKANEKCALLHQDIKLLESEKDVLLLNKQDFERKIAYLTEEVGSYKTQIVKLNEHSAKLMAEVSNLKTSNSQLSETIVATSREKAEVERLLVACNVSKTELENSNKLLQNEKDALLGQIKSLADEKTLYQSHMTSTESAIQAYTHRIEDLQSQLTAAREANLLMTQQRDSQEVKLSQLTAQLEELTREQEKNLSSVKLLEERLTEAQLEISAKEERERELANELCAAVDTHERISSDLKLSSSEVDALKNQLEIARSSHAKEQEEFQRQLEDAFTRVSEERKEKEILLTQMNEMRINLEEAAARASSDSALFALQAAHSDMKERYIKLQKTVDQQRVLLEHATTRSRELDAEVSAGQREIKQLKDRLQMGLEHYKDKVVECLKLQESVRDFKKSGGKTEECSLSSGDTINHLQMQMQEVVSELNRRGARLMEMEQYCSKQEDLRRAAEQKVNDLVQELNTVNDALASAVKEPPSTEEEFVKLETVTINLPSILAVPALCGLTHRIYPRVHSDPVSSSSLIGPAPVVSQTLYPELSQLAVPNQQAPANSEAALPAHSAAEAVRNVELHLPNATASWRAQETAANDDSPPESLGDMLPVCPVCQFEFTPQTSASFRSAHIDMHFVGEICPMCNEKFPANSTDYAAHVQSHFTATAAGQ